jgi:AcrR family transcriptional regulator
MYGVNKMRSELVDAAKALLWEDGYGRMSPRKVIERSGAGQGSLYHHFRTKRALAAAALGEIEQELIASAGRALRDDSPPLERLRAWLALERDGLKGCRLGRLANDVEVLGADELRATLAGYFDAVLSLVEATLDEAKSRDELPEGIVPAEIAAALVATVQGGYVLSRALNDGEAILRATRGAAALLEAAAR